MVSSLEEIIKREGEEKTLDVLLLNPIAYCHKYDSTGFDYFTLRAEIIYSAVLKNYDTK